MKISPWFSHFTSSIIYWHWMCQFGITSIKVNWFSFEVLYPMIIALQFRYMEMVRLTFLQLLYDILKSNARCLPCDICSIDVVHVKIKSEFSHFVLFCFVCLCLGSLHLLLAGLLSNLKEFTHRHATPSKRDPILGNSNPSPILIIWEGFIIYRLHLANWINPLTTCHASTLAAAWSLDLLPVNFAEYIC